MRRPRYAVIEAPSVLGLFPGGVERLPEALLAAGLADRLGARHAGRVEPPPYDDRRDPETLLLNPGGIAAFSRDLADAVAAVLDAGEFPVVLGGDCSIVLGCLLALRRRDRHGLLFLDGHADFYQPEAEPNGEVASMELALATGRGPAILSDLDGRGPLVRDTDVVVFGRRDGSEAEANGSRRVEDTDIRMIDLAEVRAHGCADRARPVRSAPVPTRAVGLLDAPRRGRRSTTTSCPPSTTGSPAGSPGTSWPRRSNTHLASDRSRGLSVTIFNPDLDPDGTIARSFVDALVRALVSA